MACNLHGTRAVTTAEDLRSRSSALHLPAALWRRLRNAASWAAAKRRRWSVFWYVVAGALLLCYAICLLRTAWLCDDSYITFRVVDNLTEGHGLRWNIADRVQTYTHPLWMLLVSGLHLVTGEIFYTVTVLSIVLSFAAVAVVTTRVARTPAHAAAGLAILLSSKAFVDFSTSGLENPLTHLLLALLLWTYFSELRPRRRIALLSVLAGLAVLNRMDVVFLLAPLLLAEAWRRRSVATCGALLAGFTPLLVWLAFATFYYGSPFPITAYAKALSTGIPQSALAEQGLSYLTHSLRSDPVTLPSLGLCVLLGAVDARRRRRLPLVFGILLYFGYIVKIGGDFMSGRFLAAPLFISTPLLVRYERRAVPAVCAAVATAAVVVGLGVTPRPNLTSGPGYDYKVVGDDGIADERGFYYPALGLLSSRRHDTPQPGRLSATLRSEGQRRTVFSVERMVGMAGFTGGPMVHLVDIWLCDPLVARLPVRDLSRWRPGHYTRRIPRGYLDTLIAGTNLITNPSLARYWDKISLITRGQLWSRTRLEAIWGLLTGRYDALLDRYVASDYREPHLQRVSSDQLTRRGRLHDRWDRPGRLLIYEGGVEITFETLQYGYALDLGLDCCDSYRIVFLKGSQRLATKRVTTSPVRGSGLDRVVIDAPPTALDKGYDRIRVLPGQTRDDVFSIGWLRVLAAR